MMPAVAPDRAEYAAKVRDFMAGKPDVDSDGACYKDAEHQVPVSYIEYYLPFFRRLRSKPIAVLLDLASFYDVPTAGVKKTELAREVETAALSSPRYTMLCTMVDGSGNITSSAVLASEDGCLFIVLICARSGGSRLLHYIAEFAREYNYSGVSLTAANFALFKYYIRQGFRVSPNHANLTRQLMDFLPAPEDNVPTKTMRSVASLLLSEQRSPQFGPGVSEAQRFEAAAKALYDVPFMSGIPMTLNLLAE